jgi:hypothetical protein
LYATSAAITLYARSAGLKLLLVRSPDATPFGLGLKRRRSSIELASRSAKRRLLIEGAVRACEERAQLPGSVSVAEAQCASRYGAYLDGGNRGQLKDFAALLGH